ncbi:MAG TPA: glycoside hydrolase family 76 protein [Labilithrix sp.]|nr:glycoside hydrolase family 76 protein [Labilithrix sp.]
MPGTPLEDAGEDAGQSDAGTDAPAADPAIEAMHQRADRALEALMLQYWSQLRDTDTYWTYAHDWDVVLDGAERRGPNAYSGTIRMFYESRNARGWGREFYDDLNWMVLTLVRAYDLSSDATYLTKAREIFAEIIGGWDETCCGTNKGGIWWSTDKGSKVTASNAGPVIAAARLFERTNDSSYLAFAKKTYEFWAANMVDPATGHVYDNISSKGELNTAWSFTYNEGLMIGAAVALAHAEKDASRLTLAHEIASYMLDKETRPTPLGPIISDGPCGSKGGDDGELFKGIGIRYLAELYLADPSHTEYKEAIVRSATAAWTYARDPATNLISCDWAAPYNPDTDGVNSLASAAMTLAAAARVMGPGEPRPALVYEAEETNLHTVGIEAKYGGFTGWGYTAGWGSNGQSIDFLVDVPKAGAYDVELRYATGEDAIRRVSVNGATAIVSAPFDATGGYGTYGSTTLALTLPSGKSTITFGYDFKSGGKGFLNLDRAQLVAK